VIAAFAIPVLNHLLGQASWARQRLAPFTGRCAQVDLAPWCLVFVINDEGLCEPVVSGQPDVTIGLPAGAPLLALLGIDRVLAGAHVSGNAEFAAALSFVLNNLRWEAEEDLSRLVGDIAAHRLMAGASSLVAWQRQTGQKLAENLGEYLNEEYRVLVSRRQGAEFRSEVDRLTEDIAGLMARVKDIARARGTPDPSQPPPSAL